MRDQELVSRHNIDKCLKEIEAHEYRAYDTETTGLYPHHGDGPFSAAISTLDKDYYFNWNAYEHEDTPLPEELVLGADAWGKINKLAKTGFWFMHNAKFDMAMSRAVGVSGWNNVLCTKVGARLVHNDLGYYSLAASGARIGFEKDMKVEEYIKKNNLYEQKTRGHKSWKKPRYDLVPFELISTYAMRDSYVCLKLGINQIERLQERERVQDRVTSPLKVLRNEVHLNHVLHDMEHVGTKINPDYCLKAIKELDATMKKASDQFLMDTGKELILSAKCLLEVFHDERSKFIRTAKGNLQFDADVLKTFENPAAKLVLSYKEAKAKLDFFQSFMFNSDKDFVIHTTFDSGGTRTGRFSSYNPNLQNLKKDEGGLEDTLVVRRAIIPRDGYFLAMIDYDQIEYRLMLDYAKSHGLIRKVKSGLDVHTATAELAGCTTTQEKTVNFLTLYGGGAAKLAAGLGTTEEQALEIQASIFRASPEIKTFIRNCIGQARTARKITNWLGRTYFFDDRRFCYKAPNTLIQGGAGDVVKVAMVNVHEFLKDKKSRMLLNIHDELIFEIHDSEENILPEIKRLMEEAYPYKELPLTCGIEFSRKSLADKKEWVSI